MERMMKLQDVILKAMAKKITWIAAAEIAGMSVRNMQRKRAEYQAHGYTGLFDQRRGKRSIHRIPMELAEKVLQLYQERYFDLSVRHFHEKLCVEHEIELSYSWVKQSAARSRASEGARQAGLTPATSRTQADDGHDAAYRRQQASLVPGRPLLRPACDP
jgi:hypothetical protein